MTGQAYSNKADIQIESLETILYGEIHPIGVAFVAVEVGSPAAKIFSPHL